MNALRAFIDKTKPIHHFFSVPEVFTPGAAKDLEFRSRLRVFLFGFRSRLRQDPVFSFRTWSRSQKFVKNQAWTGDTFHFQEQQASAWFSYRAFLKIKQRPCQGRIHMGRNGAIAPLKPANVTFSTTIWNNSENSVRNIRPFCCPLFVSAVL